MAPPKPTLDDLLTGPSPDITVTKIDFAETSIPQNAGLYAVVLDNVLTASESAELLAYAESVGPWERAMVNIGGGMQIVATETRNCGRIIWDDRKIVERLWNRIVPHVPEITSLKGQPEVTGYGPVKRKEVWNCTRLNERMRFLKYVGGEYFKAHCDGAYETPDETERSYYTLHLYLNDDSNLATGEKPLKGGATRFHSWNMQEEVDVVPKIGRVLIFQHRDLLHSGDDVREGTKYTMRTDVMYMKNKAE